MGSEYFIVEAYCIYEIYYYLCSVKRDRTKRNERKKENENDNDSKSLHS